MDGSIPVTPEEMYNMLFRVPKITDGVDMAKSKLILGRYDCVEVGCAISSGGACRGLSKGYISVPLSVILAGRPASLDVWVVVLMTRRRSEC